MKKTLILIALAFLMTACFPTGNTKSEPKKSVAKESVWDYYLVGTWKSDNGIETFGGDGYYRCETTKNGKNIIVEGTWRLDDTQDFVVWVTKTSAKSGDKVLSKEKKKIKYVIASLAPNKSLNYLVGEQCYSATWIKQ
jgi:hypothetical protein